MQSIIELDEECWTHEKNRYFNNHRNHYCNESTNKESYYSSTVEDKDFTVDIGNTQCLVNLSVRGDLKQISFYRDAYLTEDKPGTWVSKSFTQEQHLNTKLWIHNSEVPLCEVATDVSFDLLFNVLPRFIYEMGKNKILQIYIPLVDQKNRPISGIAVYTSSRLSDTEMNPIFPNFFQKKYSDTHNVEIYYKNKSRTSNAKRSWYILTDPNSKFYETDGKVENLIISSFEYYKNLCGDLKIDDYPTLAKLITRSEFNSNNTLASDSSGNIVGSNWGSYPVISRTWLRDMFYTVLPQLYFQPELFKKTILWFDKYQVKSPGSKFKGGLQNSVVNSLNSTLLIGLYYEYWGPDFIRENPEVWENSLNTVKKLIDRLDSDHFLIKSDWLSDGIAVGEFHTGTQIVLWKSIRIVSNILKFEFNEQQLSDYFSEVAKKLKSSVIKNCVTKYDKNTVFLEGCNLKDNCEYISAKNYEKQFVDQGLPFLTRVNNDGRINLKFHDGEESDTTLIPFYGFLDVDDKLYKKSMEFSGSSNNPTFSLLSQGISWGNQSEATFPGFITVLMGNETQIQFSQQIKKLFRLTDLDGSWWWWPYKIGQSKNNVSRFNSCGKCGWASGVFDALAMKNILGIDYNYNLKCLKIHLNKINPDYEWKQLKMPFGTINLKVENKKTKASLKINFQTINEKAIESIELSNSIVNKTITVNKYKKNLRMEIVNESNEFNKI